MSDPRKIIALNENPAEKSICGRCGHGVAMIIGLPVTVPVAGGQAVRETVPMPAYSCEHGFVTAPASAGIAVIECEGFDEGDPVDPEPGPAGGEPA